MASGAEIVGFRSFYGLGFTPVGRTMRATQTCSLPRVVGCGLMSLFVVLGASGCFDDTSPVSPTEIEVVVDAPTVDNATVQKGASFILSVTVSNDGTATSPAITLNYYLSADTTISSADIGHDDFEFGYRDGHRRRGSAGQWRELARVSESYGARDSRHVLLRRLRGRGEWRVRYGE